jgi:hypothetical protein
MSNNSTEINFSNIPETRVVDNSSKIIIDTEDGLRLIAIEDIVYKNYNAEFGPTVENNTANLNIINDNFFIAASALNINTELKGSIALYYKMRPADLREVIIKNVMDYIIPYNFIGANSLNSFYDSADQILANDGSILLPPGTYRVRAATTFSIRNPGKHYEEAGVFVGEPYGCNLYTNISQIDTPKRTMLVGDIKYAPARALKGKTCITSTIDGFFYICKTARIALRVSTDGNLVLGDGSLDNNALPKPPLINYAHYNGTTYPAQIILERVSQDDIYSLLGVNLDIVN